MEFQHSLDQARAAAETYWGRSPLGAIDSVRRLWRGPILSAPAYALPRHLRWLAESGQFNEGRRVFLVTWRATSGPDAPPRLRHVLVEDLDLSVRELPADT